MTALALASAVAAMLANSAASLLQAAGSRRASGSRPPWRQPVYLLGLLLDGLGWVLSVAALRVLPVFAVQAVLTSTVAVTTVAGRGGDPRRLPRAEALAVLGVVLGLVGVAGSAAPGRPEQLPAAATPVLLVAAVAVPVLGGVVRRRGRPLVTAAVAGISYGGASLSVRAVHVHSDTWRGLGELLTEPLGLAVVVFGVTGVVLLASALRRGRVGTVTAVLSVTETLVPGLAGIALLGDATRSGWGPVLAVGLLVTVASVALLARTGGPQPLEPVRPRATR